jgi:transcriptional regulator with XRE-family HTH domain
MMKKTKASILETLRGLIKNKPDITFGEFLKAVRSEAEMTQREMAKRVGMKQPTIAAWERGSRVCGPTLGRDLAKALGLPEDIKNAFVYAAARTLKSSPKITAQEALPLEVIDGVARAIRRAGIAAGYQIDRVILDTLGSIQSGRLSADCCRDGMTICGKDGTQIRVEVLIKTMRPKRGSRSVAENIGPSFIKTVVKSTPSMFPGDTQLQERRLHE